MKENDPLVLVTLCLVIALFAAVAEVKVLHFVYVIASISKNKSISCLTQFQK
ncbi:TPA: hypothetical protein ACGO4G_000042 [Streptococcus suis]